MFDPIVEEANWLVRYAAFIKARQWVLAGFEAALTPEERKQIGSISTAASGDPVVVTIALTGRAANNDNFLLRKLLARLDANGKADKEVDSSGTSLGLTATTPDRTRIILYGEVPRTCRIVEEVVTVPETTVTTPAHNEVKRRIVCDPDVE